MSWRSPAMMSSALTAWAGKEALESGDARSDHHLSHVGGRR
jgi:hypothetical protein